MNYDANRNIVGEYDKYIYFIYFTHKNHGKEEKKMFGITLQIFSNSQAYPNW